MATSTISANNATQTYIEASNGITGGIRLWKDPNSKTVRAYGYFRRSTDITVNTDIFVVPDGYRPATEYALPCFLYTSGNAGVAFTASVYASGSVRQRLGATIREGIIVGEWQYA